MDGGRDTEIAMGAYQPHHLAATSQQKGHIFGFRMALWFEHLRELYPSYRHPETLECIQQVNLIADRNWKLYSSDTFNEDLPGHLLSYPVVISENGDIGALPGFQFFPDTKASVLGDNKSVYLRPILTT